MVPQPGEAQRGREVSVVQVCAAAGASRGATARLLRLLSSCCPVPAPCSASLAMPARCSPQLWWHRELKPSSLPSQLRAVVRDRATVGVGQQHVEGEEKHGHHQAMERVSLLIPGGMRGGGGDQCGAAPAEHRRGSGCGGRCPGQPNPPSLCSLLTCPASLLAAGSHRAPSPVPVAAPTRNPSTSLSAGSTCD